MVTHLSTTLFLFVCLFVVLLFLLFCLLGFGLLIGCCLLMFLGWLVSWFVVWLFCLLGFGWLIAVHFGGVYLFLFVLLFCLFAFGWLVDWQLFAGVSLFITWVLFCWGQSVFAGLLQPFHQGGGARVGECPSMWDFSGRVCLGERRCMPP